MTSRLLGAVAAIGALAALVLGGVSAAGSGRAAPPPPSTTTLGLLVVAGQSNAVGWGAQGSPLAEPSPLLQPSWTPTDVSRIFWDQPDLVVAVSPGADPLALSEPQLLRATAISPVVQVFGPEIGATEVLGARSTLVVKVAEGGTDLAHDWSPTRPDGLYADLVAQVGRARGWAAARGIRLRDDGVIWFQGEQDTLSASSASNYKAELTSLLRRLRPDLGLAPATPVVVVQTSMASVYERSCPHGSCEAELGRDAQVRSAQEEVVASQPDTLLLDSAGYPRVTIGLHLSAQGELSLGRAAGRLLAGARAGR